MSHFRNRSRQDARRQPAISVSVILSIFTILLALSSCGSRAGGVNQGNTTIQTNDQGSTRVVAGIINDLHMITATTGWAVSLDIAGTGAYTILRTTDGAEHWKVTLLCRSTQGAGKGFQVPCIPDFHSISVATVLAPEYDVAAQISRSRIYHTSDGGHTWQTSVVNARYLETPAVFIDAQHGWFLATDHFPGPDPGSAYIGGKIALYRTTDGGNSWQRIISGPSTSQLPTTSDDAYGIAPLTANTRMQFVSPTTGWFAGTTFHGNSSGDGWLYVTHDAGVTWQKVVIPSQNGSVGIGLPVFFTAQNGLLLISTSGPAPQYEQKTLPYTTHDGGQSWTWTGVTTSLYISRDNFIDMTHAWAPSVNSTDMLIYTTNDGGQHWSKVPMQTTFKQLSVFSFVSPDIGWATAKNVVRFLPEPGGGMRKGDIIAVLKTTDGGRTWHEVSHSQV
jgi:photosystem II stability/assembly factor-like uncharacterized protein